MSMKVTQSLRKPYRGVKNRRYSAAWEAARAARAEKRAGLKAQPRDALGFIIVKGKDGSQSVKPDSRKAHEDAMYLKELSSQEETAGAKRRRLQKEGSK